MAVKSELEAATKIVAKNICNTCNQEFAVTEAEAAFLIKKDLPCPPRNCPTCRRQRRLAFRNERRLYYRVCDSTGQRMLSLYPQEAQKEVVIYDQGEWWNYEKMDPLSLAQEFDFNRTFFEQFAELKQRVPHPNLHNTNVQNAMYGNHCVSNKNCYLTIGSDLCEECSYTYWAIRCRDCIDCSVAYDSELCYDCVDIRICYNCYRVDNSENLIDCRYCYDCRSCHDCLGCVGLRQKEYHVLNQKVTKEEYKLMLRKLESDPESLANFQQRYEMLRRKFNYCANKNIQSEGVRGDRLWRSRHCVDSFDLENSEDVNCSTFGFNGVTSQDIDFFGRTENSYESFSAFGQNNCVSTILCHYSFDTYYSEYCISCHHLFGCVSLHHHNYCILNKEYSREEYEKLFPKIVEHMKKTDEWGDFFPIELSPFPYNVTVAQKYYPLSQEEIEERGWTYEKQDLGEIENENRPEGPPQHLPENDSEVDASICDEIMECETTGRPYRILKPEFDYLRARNLPLPRFHQDERNEIRMERRSPQQLWDHECIKCQEDVLSSYDPALGFKVYCPSCYGTEVI